MGVFIIRLTICRLSILCFLSNEQVSAQQRTAISFIMFPTKRMGCFCPFCNSLYLSIYPLCHTSTHTLSQFLERFQNDNITYPPDKLNEQLCDGEEVNRWTRHFPEQLWVSSFPDVDRQHVTQTNSFVGDPVLTLTNSHSSNKDFSLGHNKMFQAMCVLKVKVSVMTRKVLR